jgi:hypothetical protein
MTEQSDPLVFHVFHFSYAGIIRIRLLGYDLSPCVKAPPKEKNWHKDTKSDLSLSHFTTLPLYHFTILPFIVYLPIKSTHENPHHQRSKSQPFGAKGI